MKKQALKMILIASIILSGCTAKRNLIPENNINLNNSNGPSTFFPIPTNCIDGFKPIKVLHKQEKELGYFMVVSVCKISDSSIRFKQINTIENFNKDSEILFNNEHYEVLSYYNCNTEEAKKEKYKRVSICKRSDGFSELVVISPNP